MDGMAKFCMTCPLQNRHGVIKLFHTQLSMKFQLLIKTKCREKKLAFKISDVVFIPFVNDKMPKNLTFTSKINFALS